jgi:hypothetical protein
MNKKRHKVTKKVPKKYRFHLIVALIALSIVCIGSRQWILGQTPLAEGDKFWRLTINPIIKSNKNDTTVSIFPPFESPHFQILQRTLRNSGFRVRNWSEDADQRRSIQAFATKSGMQNITAVFILNQAHATFNQDRVKNIKLKAEQREKFLLDGEMLQVRSSIVGETLKKLSTGKTDRLQVIDSIFRYLNQFANSNEKNDLNVLSTLKKNSATPLDHALAMVSLSRRAGVPTRMVTGIILNENTQPTPHYWVEVYMDEKWLAYDVHYGYRHELPASYLSIRRNNRDIVEVLKGELVHLNIKLKREYNYSYQPKKEKKSIFTILNLMGLPVDTRDELALLLLLPFGVLISALWANLVGLKNYGVFTSTLLALALVYNDKLMTIVIFIVVCVLAAGGRSIFPDTIKRMPRLAIIFTLISVIMALLVSVLNFFDLSQGGKIILLPIIILTSLVDRIYRTIEDNGFQIAMRRLIWTIFVTLLCVPVLQFQTLAHLLIRYPEIHFTTLALLLAISTYKGKKLLDLPGMSLLDEPEGTKNKTKSSHEDHDL